MSDTAIITTSEPSHEEHAQLLDSIHSRMESLETRLQSLENSKADREHSHPEYEAQLAGMAQAEHSHEEYATHQDLRDVEDDIDDLTLALDEDLDDAAGLESAPLEGTTISAGPEPQDETRHKPGMLF